MMLPQFNYKGKNDRVYGRPVAIRGTYPRALRDGIRRVP